MIFRKLAYIFLTASLVSLQACMDTDILGSGVSQTLLRAVPGFGSVAIHHGLTFNFQENNTRPSSEVRLTFDNNLLGLVSTNVVNNQLEVGLIQTISSSEKRVDITGPTLTSITLTGDSIGQADRLSGRQELKFDLSGTSKLTVGHVEANHAEITMVGKTHLSLNGGAITSVVVSNAYSGAKIDAENLTTQQMELTLSRGSVARVNAARKLVVDLSENSTVYYKGVPQIETINMADNSRLIPMDLTPNP